MWLYNNIIFEEVPENVCGFVYIITNLQTQRKYIGKKLFKRSKTRQIKGKKKRSFVESDWKEYYGSNKELIEDVGLLGVHNFKREVLRLCKTKGECTYYEAKYQYEYDVLLKPGEWYNSWISCKVTKTHLKHLIC